jgi:hypothetical protein
MSYFPSISQNVIVDTVNSVSGTTIVNYVNPADIWNYNGAGTSTLGVNAIQLVVTSTKNLTIYVDQGNTPTSFQITDEYHYLTTKQFGLTVQAVGAYVRIRAKNISGASAVATIDTVLCPIVEALPRSLDDDGYLQVAIKGNIDGYGFESENTPNGDGRSITPFRQVGSAFEGPTLDSNFWSTSLLSGGTTTQTNGRIDMATNTSANGVAGLYSVRKARHIAGSANLFRMAGRFGDIGTANNVREFGVCLAANYLLTITSTGVTAGDVYTDASSVQYTVLITSTGATVTVFATGVPTAGTRVYTRVSGSGASTFTGSTFASTSVLTDGFYFQLSGTSFSVVTSIGGSATKISSGAFNGNVGTTYVVNTDMQSWEIYYNSASVWFTVNGVVLHKVENSQTPLSNTLSLHAFVRNGNLGGSTSNVLMYLRSLTIKQLGPLDTESTYKYVATNTTTICKYGGGRLKRVIFGDPDLAQIVTLYDGLSTAAPLISILTNIAASTAHGRAHTQVDFDCPFHNGLTMVTSTSIPITIIYE